MHSCGWLAWSGTRLLVALVLPAPRQQRLTPAGRRHRVCKGRRAVVSSGMGFRRLAWRCQCGVPEPRKTERAPATSSFPPLGRPRKTTRVLATVREDTYALLCCCRLLVSLLGRFPFWPLDASHPRHARAAGVVSLRCELCVGSVFFGVSGFLSGSCSFGDYACLWQKTNKDSFAARECGQVVPLPVAWTARFRVFCGLIQPDRQDRHQAVARAHNFPASRSLAVPGLLGRSVHASAQLRTGQMTVVAVLFPRVAPGKRVAYDPRCFRVRRTPYASRVWPALCLGFSIPVFV